jgi:hypothetical protein
MTFVIYITSISLKLLDVNIKVGERNPITAFSFCMSQSTKKRIPCYILQMTLSKSKYIINHTRTVSCNASNDTQSIRSAPAIRLMPTSCIKQSFMVIILAPVADIPVSKMKSNIVSTLSIIKMTLK